MDPLSWPATVALAASAAAAAGLGGWALRGRRARADANAADHVWQAQAVDQLVDAQTQSRANTQLGFEIKTLKSQLGTAIVAREATEAALARRTRDSEAATSALRRSTAELTARDLQLDELSRVAAALAPLRVALVDREQALGQAAKDRQDLARRVEELTRVRSRLESEVMRLGVRAESQERDLEIATAARLEAVEGRLAAEARPMPSPPEPDPGADRRRTLETARRQARDDSATGSLQARADRAEALVRQLEDRDALLRAATFERDQVLRRLVEAEREQRRTAEALADAQRRLETDDTLAAENQRRSDAAERKVASAMRERDEAGGLARRLSLEAETLRAELRDRDGRFRALARETDARVRELEDRAAELESDLYLSSTVVSGTIGILAGNGSAAARDDLARIVTIGRDLAARLADQGITTFRQVAEWSDDDIDRIGPLIGAAPDSIRRDGWVGLARDAMAAAGH